jgi:hypothetical protein
LAETPSFTETPIPNTHQSSDPFEDVKKVEAALRLMLMHYCSMIDRIMHSEKSIKCE